MEKADSWADRRLGCCQADATILRTVVIGRRVAKDHKVWFEWRELYQRQVFYEPSTRETLEPVERFLEKRL